ncbi:MAG: bifunctional 5,10-methylenetetrahydrofolate dehydrogenase/5,10-methenyltetrahydrofolate cyclohydrolase [Candidatus Omnitrophica bacterium]|nr:bifunctional 5,10-methylenetetrahydrofolate dehydrogenase/5,10-methenyltetrahydrofolate cyclohydrolase [Candidatus Omnitrophota bacterium]
MRGDVSAKSAGTRAVILDGKAIAGRLAQEISRDIAALRSTPMLAILSFATPASEVYRKAQREQAQALGIQTREHACPMSATQADVERIIQGWNADAAIHGMFVHQPMPPGVDPQRISAAIDPRKDIEGIHPQNSARRFFAKARIGSCTALAVMRLIEETGAALEGKDAVVVGHSEIVGRPVSMLLLDKLATTTVCHVGTDKAGRLEEHVRRADILVVAAGRPQLIKGAWIKPGAIVIDVGINVVGGRVVGDVEFEAAKTRAGFITPVPGGVGPVTVMMVMKNTVEAFKLQQVVG